MPSETLIHDSTKCWGTLLLLRPLANLDDHDEATGSSSPDIPITFREPPASQSAATPEAAPLGTSRFGTVLALVGTGLLMQGIGDALDRTGHRRPDLALFLCGIAVIFTACAWRLLGSPASRKERVQVSVVLGLGLLASYVMHRPLLLDSFDEMAHGATLMRMLENRPLIPTNTILPVSPYYPGLELVTAATRWLTGLPLALDQVIVLAAARLVVVLGVFLVVERACRSSRAGGIGVLVYAGNPQFYGFDAQYAYETLALAFAVAAVHLLIVSIDTGRPKMGRSFVLGIGCIVAMVFTHHLTGWLTIGFLVVWAVALYLIARARTRPSTDHVEAPVASNGHPVARDQPELDQRITSRRGAQARIVGIAALFGVTVGGAWTAIVGSRVIGYVGPIIDDAYANVQRALGQLHGNRQLFRNSTGGGSPKWEIALMLGAAVLWCLILLPSLYSVIWKRTVRGGPLRFLPAVIAATYPLALLANISSASKLVAERAMTFIFLGMAVVVGGWLARRLLRDRRTVERVATIVIAAICFLGSMLFGGGPLPSYLPGPYQVGADELSLGPPSLALAHWTNSHLPAGAHVAADRDNGALLNDIGGVESVAPEDGLANPSTLFFDRQLTPWDVSLIRQSGIRYIAIDDRLAEGLPLYGTYIAPGEPQSRLTEADLQKFKSVPWARLIYDNGPIQVYDLSVLLGKSPLVAPPGVIGGAVGTGLDVGIFLVALLVVAMWTIRLRRRSRRGRIDVHMVLCGVSAALVTALVGAFLVRLTRWPPNAVALGALLVLLLLSLRPTNWRLSSLPAVRRRLNRSDGSTRSPVGAVSPEELGTNGTAPRPDSPTPNLEAASPSPPSTRTRRSRSQMALGCVGVVLVALGVSLATVTAVKEWTPPPELSVMYGPTGQAVADVQLGTAGPIPTGIEITNGGKAVWLKLLTKETGPQTLNLPARFVHPGSRVLLVSSGRTLREVDG